MFLRKFYSPDDSFAGAKLEDFKIVERTAVQVPAQEAETVTPDTVPAVIVDTPAEPATPAEVVPETTPVEQQTQTVSPQAEQKKVTPTIVQKNWEDLLKDEGFDDQDLAMLKHRKATGSYKDYLEAMSVNYKDMPAEEIMRRDLREQYPNMTPENFERFYRKQVIEKYNLDSDLSPSEEDTALGREILAHDAESKRQKFLEKQNSFIVPDKDIAGEQQRQIEEQNQIAAQQQESFKQSILSNEVTQSLVKDRKLVLDAGDGMQFNYEVDSPQDMVDILLNPDKYQAAMTTKDAQGNITPDFKKTLILAAVAKNPQGVFKALINHGKNLGKQEYIDKLENAEKGSGTTPVTGEMSMGQAFLTNGVRRNF